MKVRVMTAAVLLITLVPAVLIGGVFLDFILVLLTMGAAYELIKMYKGDNFKIDGILINEVLLSGIVFMGISYYLKTSSYSGVFDYIFIVGLFIIFYVGLLMIFIEDFSIKRFGRVFVVILYPAVGFAAISWLRDIDIYHIGFLFMITIFTDVFAYIFGVKYGKHRLAVKISPKKSIEGSIGGTVFALILTMLYLYLLDIDVIGEINLNIGISIVLIIFLSMIGQIGDLIASKLKREFGIKDFSQIFPGHGGVMDRFDSAIFAAIVLLLISEIVGLL